MEILTKDIPMQKNTAVAIGNFDGVHIAHRALITAAAERKDLESVVFTFYPHTANVFGKKTERIISEEEKRAQIRELAPDYLYIQSCDREFLSMSPREFAKKVLKDTFSAACVYVGYNFSFGKDGAGTPETLKELGKELGFEVFVMPPFELSGAPVSSSRIRKALANGETEAANKMLGRPFSVSGKVVTGNKIGRTLGFPTANLIPKSGFVMPRCGVYATRTIWSGQIFDSVTNVGDNPTVSDGGTTRVETNIMDLDRNLYGEEIRVLFYGLLRSEKKFCSLDELKQQIEKDKYNAKKYLTKV